MNEKKEYPRGSALAHHAVFLILDIKFSSGKILTKSKVKSLKFKVNAYAKLSTQQSDKFGKKNRR